MNMKKFAISVIKPENFIHYRVFDEVAASLDFAFRKLNLDSIITDDLFLSDRQYIILGANLLRVCPKIRIKEDSIIYQLEREDSVEQFDKFYIDLLNKFKVWDYSSINMERINKRYNLNINDVLPLGYTKELNTINHSKKKDIDVLFVGSLSSRRKKIISDMVNNNLNAIALYNYYGKQRDDYIARSKIMLNMHFHGSGLLEHPRIFYYIHNNCFVLSEVSNSDDENNFFSSVLYLTKYEDILSKVFDVLNGKINIHKYEINIKKFLQDKPQELYLLERIKNL